MGISRSNKDRFNPIKFQPSEGVEMGEYELTPEMARERQRESLGVLKAGDLFQLTARMWCLCMNKISDREWEVIKLTPENRIKLVTGQEPEKERLNWDDMPHGIYFPPDE